MECLRDDFLTNNWSLINCWQFPVYNIYFLKPDDIFHFDLIKLYYFIRQFNDYCNQNLNSGSKFTKFQKDK